MVDGLGAHLKACCYATCGVALHDDTSFQLGCWEESIAMITSMRQSPHKIIYMIPVTPLKLGSLVSRS